MVVEAILQKGMIDFFFGCKSASKCPGKEEVEVKIFFYENKTCLLSQGRQSFQHHLSPPFSSSSDKHKAGTAGARYPGGWPDFRVIVTS